MDIRDFRGYPTGYPHGQFDQGWRSKTTRIMDASKYIVHHQQNVPLVEGVAVEVTLGTRLVLVPVVAFAFRRVVGCRSPSAKRL